MNMTNMFYGASSFNQDLGRWNVNKCEKLLIILLMTKILSGNKINQNLIT